MYSLLQQRQRDIEFRESASEQRQRVREAAVQERLNQVVMEKKKQSRSGMEIMNLLQKEGRQHGTWNGKKAGNNFYKKLYGVISISIAIRWMLMSQKIKMIFQPDIIAPGVAVLAAFSPAASPSDDIKYDKDL
ncbi:hypothetical protein AgCh_021581 [Apium graveolens]